MKMIDLKLDVTYSMPFHDSVLILMKHRNFPIRVGGTARIIANTQIVIVKDRGNSRQY
jgi:hypothetical protein